MAELAERTDQPAPRMILGHPIGLANLFGVELWERFSFYGMLTILGYSGWSISQRSSVVVSPTAWSGWNAPSSTEAWS
jgi:hypothetical protein